MSLFFRIFLKITKFVLRRLCYVPRFFVLFTDHERFILDEAIDLVLSVESRFDDPNFDNPNVDEDLYIDN